LVALLVGLGVLAAWPRPGDVRADDPPGAYKAESPEPTPAETLILEYVNRCRLNPAEDAIRCLQASGVPANVDASMFKQEMLDASPVPPLVFDLALLKAARWHSSYQIANGQTHDEEPGKQGYTGHSLSERTHLAGFPDGRVGENIFRTAKNLWYCHAAFIIDWGPGPGGKENVKFDVLVSDLAVFRRGAKLLAAAKKIPESKKGPRFAALVDLYLSTRDTLVEEETLEEITSLVEEVHQVLDKDMAEVRQAVAGDVSDESSKQVQTIARKYAHTKAESWFNDAMTCQKMNATYLRLKSMREDNKPLPASMLDRVAKDQQKKLSKLTVPEWRKAGMALVLKTAAAGGSGTGESKSASP
jgi:hypothetical protein